MRFVPLVWRNLLRRPLRTLFTALSVFVAFVLFGVLAAVRSAFSLGVEIAGADRLVTIHKVSLVQPLPIRYLERIRAVEGVAEVTHATWFGGIYREPSNFFAQMAVDPDAWLRMYPEFVVPADQRRAWIADQTGALVGRDLAERFGWSLGTTVPLQGTIFRHPNANTWRFVVRGIYDAGKPGTDTTQFFFHRKYLEESIRGTPMAGFTGLVGWYIIRVADPERAADIAGRIDAEFANSDYETKTTTEKAFVQAFAAQIGDIGAITIAITAAVFFTILLVAGNTMAQAIRERTNELAVLKTLGFSNRLVLVLVLGESIALAAGGGLAGLAVGWLLVSAGDPTGGMLPGFLLPPRDLAAGAGLVILLGLAAGLLPAVQATRLRIADALRRA